jgi:hypothetical protein
MQERAAKQIFILIIDTQNIIWQIIFIIQLYFPKVNKRKYCAEVWLIWISNLHSTNERFYRFANIIDNAIAFLVENIEVKIYNPAI